MKYYLEYGAKKAKCIELNVNPSVPFPRVVQTITKIEIKNCPTTELIRYAVLELISNSIRSHLERQVNDTIKVIFSLTADNLCVNIEDRGGGFDPAILPYDINQNPHIVDLNSHSFQKYRETNGYARFGMGLLSAKRIFHNFSIKFITDSGLSETWSCSVKGTFISGTVQLQ